MSTEAIVKDLIGGTLGQYQIISEIGRGRMAIVYKAIGQTIQMITQ